MERLCERVQSSTLLEDRRDAVRALKSLSKVVKYVTSNNWPIYRDNFWLSFYIIMCDII